MRYYSVFKKRLFSLKSIMHGRKPSLKITNETVLLNRSNQVVGLEFLLRVTGHYYWFFKKYFFLESQFVKLKLILQNIFSHSFSHFYALHKSEYTIKTPLPNQPITHKPIKPSSVLHTLIYNNLCTGTCSFDMIEIKHLSLGDWLEGLILDKDDTNVDCSSETLEILSQWFGGLKQN